MSNSIHAYSALEISRAKYHAIISACFGSLSAGLIGDSPVIMIMAEKMNAGQMISLMTTSLIPLAYFVMLLPMGWIAARLGYRRTIISFTAAGFILMTLLSFSPQFGIASKSVMMFSIAGFGVCMAAYNAAWFPFIDNFLPKNQRPEFFGNLRFCWQSFSVLFFFICGMMLGKSPAMWSLQLVVLIATFGLLGRIIHVMQIPQYAEKPEPVKFLIGLTDVLRNKALTGYSVYLCFLYLFCFATQPVAFLYVKNALNIPANIVIVISAIALSGSIIGFLAAGKIINKVSTYRVIVVSHLLFILINFGMFLTGGNSWLSIALITMLLLINSLMLSLISVTTTSEMFVMSSGWNRAMSMAFCGCLYSLGSGCARMMSSLIIGSGMLAENWVIGARQFSNYQTIFLFNGCALLFVCLMLLMVPAVFPKGKYRYIVITN